jgi:Uma2 family endonuclease
MAHPEPRPATYQDIIDLPEHLVGEIIAGELHTQPRPAPRHARASSVVGGKLTGPFDAGDGGPGGWWILDEPELHLGPHILVPDLAGWRRERMSRLPGMAWFELAPDWACEVLLPGTARKDRVKKMPIYGGSGVGHLWLLDPDQRIPGGLRRWPLAAAWGIRERGRSGCRPFRRHRVQSRRVVVGLTQGVQSSRVVSPLLAPETFFPFRRVLRAMENGIDDDAFVCRFVEDFEGKPPNQCAAKIVNGDSVQKRMTLNIFYARSDATQELLSESRLSILVPTV